MDEDPTQPSDIAEGGGDAVDADVHDVLTVDRMRVHRSLPRIKAILEDETVGTHTYLYSYGEFAHATHRY